MLGQSINILSPCRTLLSMMSILAIVTASATTSVDNDDEFSLLQVSVKPGAQSLQHVGLKVSHPYDRKGSLSPLSLLHIHVPYTHIAVNVSYSNIQEEIWTFPQRRPREFNVLLATFKTWLADMIVQFVQRPSGTNWSFDFRRSFAFAIFGLLYVGLTQWFLYVTILTWLFPDALIFANSPMAFKMTDFDGQMDMLGQVAVDNLFFNVFIYFPAFYMIKEFIQGEGNLLDKMRAALDKYSHNVWQDNVRSFCVWVPADFFVFACPMYMRMPMEHGVSFGWTMLMSVTRGQVVAEKTPRTKAEKEAS